MNLTVLACTLSLFGALAGDEPTASKPMLREIDASELSFPRERQRDPYRPTKITSAMDLEKVLADAEQRKQLLGQVDFTREYLLLFRWSGSGQDRLRLAVVKGKEGHELSIDLQRGLTRDLRQHLKLFAVLREVAYTPAEKK